MEGGAVTVGKHRTGSLRKRTMAVPQLRMTSAVEDDKG